MSKTQREKPRHDTVMDVMEEQIARVYAQAFLGAVAKHANVADYVDEISAIVRDVLDPFPNLEDLLRSALLAHEHKEQILDRVFGPLVATDMLHFLKVLSRHDRLGLLRQVARLVGKLYSQQCGQATVELRVASEIDDALRNEIRDLLQKKLGKEPMLNVVVDPSLIAGMVVRVGDRVYDGSVYTQLNNARKAMIARAADLIEAGPERFLQTAG
jgi:F-type H+-transporting ATPase subunit delta